MLILPVSSHSGSEQCLRGVWVSAECVGLPEAGQFAEVRGHTLLLLAQPAVWRTGRRHDGGSESFVFHFPPSQVRQVCRCGVFYFDQH